LRFVKAVLTQHSVPVTDEIEPGRRAARRLLLTR
jgi:hypothetical protein